jgi:hypothetical protein
MLPDDPTIDENGASRERWRPARLGLRSSPEVADSSGERTGRPRSQDSQVSDASSLSHDHVHKLARDVNHLTRLLTIQVAQHSFVLQSYRASLLFI